MAKKLKISKNATVSIGPATVGNTAVTYTVIQNGKSIKATGTKTTFEDVTTFGPGTVRQRMPTLQDPGEITIELLVDPGNAEDMLLEDLQTNTTESCLKVTLPNSSNTTLTTVYTGYVTAYDYSDINFEKVPSATLEFTYHDKKRTVA